MRWLTLGGLIVLALSACGDKNAEDCPAQAPAAGSACTLDATRTCKFQVVQKCQPPDSDIRWQCACASGKWSCGQDGFDCYYGPLRDVGPDVRRHDALPDLPSTPDGLLRDRSRE